MYIEVSKFTEQQNAMQAPLLQMNSETDFGTKSGVKKKNSWIPKLLWMRAYNWQVSWYSLCMLGCFLDLKNFNIAKCQFYRLHYN